MSKYLPLIQFVKSQYPGRDFIPLHEPRFLGNEKAYLLDTIDSTYVSSVGAYVDRFEGMLAEIAGTKHAVATVNGTAALHMALLIAGVKENDLVITQSLTFVATCNAISYLKAGPVFVDVERDTMGMSPKALEQWLEKNAYQKKNAATGEFATFHKGSGRKISAVVPMHTFGHPCRIDLITKICQDRYIPMVEDAAESLGSYFKGKHTGGFGLLGTFSFNGNKTVTCGGGGAITTNDEKLAKLAKHLTTQSKVPHVWEFYHDHIGYNYRMPNLNAALACAQLEQLEHFVADKRRLSNEYAAFLQSRGDIVFKEEPVDSLSNYWLNTIELGNQDERDAFLQFSNAQGVMARPAWTPMHKLPMFKHAPHDELENSQYLAERLVNLPSSVRI